ncbi:lysozyme family protein [Carnobacterium divergens]|uniref:lysozyme family protein n=1 Tax=Carnobacterium divergens TaxID=2748 RepID=UPI00288F5AF9|nr:lysozyme family protein [Carnobacterium divergens]MDT2010825.1 lysozyme family protein [Carnobacterium divergens]
MKSFKKKIALFLLPYVIGLSLIMAIGGMFSSSTPESSQGDGNVGVTGLPPEVMKWEPAVIELTTKYNILEYKNYILCIIMVESGGKGTDPMQSSESAGQEAGAIQDPLISLNQGVSYYANLVNKAKELNVTDVDVINQAYNFGGSYISNIAKKGGKHSLDLAEEYSKTVVAPSLGNNSGSTYSYKNVVSEKYGRTYLYLNGGNFYYSFLLKQYLTTGNTSGKYIVPVDNPQISSGFVDRINPVTGAPESHKGLDFAQPQGDNIKASQDGEVVVAQFDGQPVQGYGKCTILKHSDGTYTLYAHQSEQLVTVGDKVKQGQVIGKVGSTGQSTGSHLHFEIRKDYYGGQVDPAPALGIS